MGREIVLWCSAAWRSAVWCGMDGNRRRDQPHCIVWCAVLCVMCRVLRCVPHHGGLPAASRTCPRLLRHRDTDTALWGVLATADGAAGVRLSIVHHTHPRTCTHVTCVTSLRLR